MYAMEGVTLVSQISTIAWTFVAGNGSGSVCFESDAAGCLVGIDQINDIFQSISLALSLSLPPSLHLCLQMYVYRLNFIGNYLYKNIMLHAST